MANEENELLLKDLCARLLYGVKIKYHYKRENNVINEIRELSFSDVETLKYNNEYPQDYWCEISWKPYLRPMSSMTDEEKDYYDSITYTEDETHFKGIWCDSVVNWLNKKMFDYRGLIPMGLAMEAPEGMYNK